MSEPKLDLMLIDTHNPKLLGIVDTSTYPPIYNISAPTIEITVSGFSKVTLEFTPKNLNLYNSNNLGITCDAECLSPINDGIIKLKYSIFPANEFYVEKTFLRTDQIQEKFDTAFMQLDLNQCDGPLRDSQKRQLDEAYYFLQMAIAAANKGSLQLATNLYQKASKMLDAFINKTSCNGKSCL